MKQQVYIVTKYEDVLGVFLDEKRAEKFREFCDGECVLSELNPEIPTDKLAWSCWYHLRSKKSKIQIQRCSGFDVSSDLSYWYWVDILHIDLFAVDEKHAEEEFRNIVNSFLAGEIKAYFTTADGSKHVYKMIDGKIQREK